MTRTKQKDDAANLLKQRNELIRLSKELLMTHENHDEHMALKIVYSRMHGGAYVAPLKKNIPW